MPNVTADNFYLDGGLVQEFLPGNIINANLQGYSTFFNKNMPTSFVNDSLAYFQQTTPQVKYPQDKVEVIENPQGQASDTTPTKQDNDFIKRLYDLFVTGGSAAMGNYGVIPPTVNQQIKGKSNTKATSTVCEGLSDDSWSGIPFLSICNTSVEGSKRIGLVVAGLLLLALGVWSLR